MRKVKLTNADVDVNALTQPKRYICKTKASAIERIQADSIQFASWMVTPEANSSKKEWETVFNTRVAPVLEEMEVMIQSSIDVMAKLDQEKDKIQDNPSSGAAVTLEK